MKPLAVAISVVAVVAAGVGAAGTAVAAYAGEALPGTTVAGIDVGGLGPAGIERALADEGRSRSTGTIVLVAGDERVELERETLGVRVDLAETAERAVASGRDGVLDVLLAPLKDDERDVDLVVQVDEAVLDERARALAAQVAREPRPGGFAVRGTSVVTQLPERGRRLDEQAARAALLDAARSGAAQVRMPVEQIDPGVTAERAEQVAVAARRALEAPYRLSSADSTLSIEPAELAPLLSSRVIDGRLELDVDRAALRDLVASRAGGIDQRPRNAQFDVVGAPPLVDGKGSLQWAPRPAEVRVVPGSAGREVDVDAATDRLLGLLAGEARTGELPLRATPPALTTEQADAAGVRDLIGTFTTHYAPGQPRAKNIRRIAEIVDGTYLPPGETFSLNRTAGRRTLARGFVEDAAIIDGRLEDVVGGGVSQFATTIFNAAFFAGLPIPQHQPHSFYISRYPAGRESTVNFGSIDVQFRNDTGKGIWIDTSTTGTSVTVALYGDNGGRRVEAVHGAAQPRQGGGFRISVTRLVTGGDGKGGRRVFSTTYKAPPED